MTKRDRLMLMAVLAVALLGGFWMLVLSPQRKAATEAEAAVATAQSALATAQQQLDAGRKAQSAFRRDRTTIVKLGRVVPETDDIPTLLTNLETLGKKHKVKFTSYNVNSAGGGTSTTAASGGAPAKSSSTNTGSATATGSRSTDAVAPVFPPGSVEISGGLGRTPIEVELQGTYFNLEKYLRAVQRFAILSQKQTTTKGRLMVVDAFSYEFLEGEDNQDSLHPKLKAKLSASVYFAPPLDTPAASGSAGAAPSATPASSGAAPSSSTTGAAAVGGIK